MRQVVVTGGGTGIGKAIAAAFVQEGDSVVITGRRPEPLARAVDELGDNVRAVRFDAADPQQVTEALAELPDIINVLVNTAGGNTDIGAPDSVNLHDLAAAWRANLESNLISSVLVTTAVRDRIAQGGAIINFSSIAARRPGAGSYSAAKAAVEAWNLTLAQDVGADRITANVISPGFVDGTEFFRGRMTDDRRAILISQTLTGRSGTAEDIAAAAVFLASSAASHITAQTIHVNGGALS